jgi:copper chaperone CopZ
VKDHQVNQFTHEAVVTFDDTKTSLEAIVKALTDDGFPPSGQPQWVK